MSDNINSSSHCSVDTVDIQSNKLENSSKYNSHNSAVIVDSSQNSDSKNTKCSGDESKTSPSTKITMVGVHFVISSPKNDPATPLIPPP